MKFQLYVASLVLCLAGQTAFAQLVITEAVPNPGAPNPGTLANLDWWELTNTGPATVSLDGFEWNDFPSDSGESAIFPNGVSVAAGESIIIHRDNGLTGVADAFRTDWGLSPSVQVLTESQFTGLDPFSGLGSTNGDQVNLFDGPVPPGAGSLVSSALFGPAAPGLSFEWGTDGTGLGMSVLGKNGAFGASNGRVGSPGVAAAGGGLPAVVFADTFELTVFTTPPTETNVNAEFPFRQGGSITSGLSAGGNFLPFIQDDASPNGSDSLVLHTEATPGGVSAVVAQHDFAPELADRKYSVSYEGLVTETGIVDAGSSWQSFGLKDEFGIAAPNAVDTDLGVLFRTNGDWSLWLDGNIIVVNGRWTDGIDTGIRIDEPYTIQFEFDETGASPTVTGTVDATLGPVVLGTLPLEGDLDGTGPLPDITGFENAGRFFTLYGLQGGSVDPSAAVDVQIDNFVIEADGVTGPNGDFDGDGDVDAADLALWELDYGQNDFSDADGDGDSDGADFLIWQRTITGSLPSSALATVPEPTSLVLLALTGIGSIACRKRQRNW